MAIHTHQNARANTSVDISHVDSYHQHCQAQNFNLPIYVVFIALSSLLRYQHVNNPSTDASNPAGQHGDTSVPGNMDRKQLPSLCFERKKQ